MKQTAVEWLNKQIEYISIQVFDGFLTFVEFMEEREKLFKQAKEMEKEQIIYAYHEGCQWGYGQQPYNCEQYYNETFKNNQNDKK